MKFTQPPDVAAQLAILHRKAQQIRVKLPEDNQNVPASRSAPAASMVVDIGRCWNQVAIISEDGVLFSRSMRVGGKHLDEDIIVHLKRTHHLLIEKQTAEQIKIGIGSAFPLEQELTMEIKGRDLSGGQPKTLTIGSEEIRGALKENLSHILLSIRISLERCPPELAADLMDCGIMMTGGGALLRGIDRLVAEDTQRLVHIADNPKTLKLPRETL